MSYIVALAPDLGISSEEFITEWNRDPEAIRVATAGSSAETRSFDPVIVAGAVTLITSVAKDVIMELVKRKLAAHDKAATPPKVEAVEQSGATVIVVVRGDKD